MPTFEEARNIILQDISTLNAETVMILDSVGRVLAEDIVAPWDMPTCSNSAMDGYAIRAADANASQVLPIVDYVPAGACAEKSLQPETAIKIMTGAPVPEGCDSVVPLEDAVEFNGKVCIQQRVTLRQHVRNVRAKLCSGGGASRTLSTTRDR
jgi:molybdopterin molybdotransferase